MRTRLALALTAAGLLAAAPPESRAQDVSPSERLRDVVDAHWDDLLRRHPLEATVYVGDHRFDDRLNDASPAAFDAWLDRLRETRRRLDAIPAADGPSGLSAEERVSLRVLHDAVSQRVDLARFGDHLMPLCQLLRTATDVHSDDLHLLFAQLGEYQPAATRGDVEDYVRRLEAFPTLADGLIATMRQGMAQKRVPPRVVMARVVPQLRALAGERPEDSPLWAFTHRLPADWPEADRRAAETRVREAIARHVAPAYRKLAGFVEAEYLPACRETVGLGETPDGPEHYSRLVRLYTTTDQTPDQIHETGLREVERVRAGMDGIRKRVGFGGDLAAFLKHVRDDPKLKAASPEAILARHRAVIAEMDAQLPRLFGRLPATRCEVRPFDAVRAKSSPAGEYLPMPADGSRPGIFFVNTLDPGTRPTYTMQALAYHEAVPGHHLQGSLAAEAPGRFPFRRFYYLPAFDEGWALYAESLPGEVGLYRDPYADLGRLVYDAQRCVRLVVDTGLHARGWSRDRAVAYFEANTTIPRNEIENEVDRYIAWPGQALAYKVGDLSIRALRAKEQVRLGAAFDVRAFHDRLLSFGSVPLRVLEPSLRESAPQRDAR